MGKRIGYARVSTQQQNEAAQIAVLEAAGCSPVFHERISTRVPDSKRPQLQAALAELEPGDILVVAKLDRLGRTQVEVINRLHDLQEKGIFVQTLDGLINTEALGKFAPVIVGLLSGLAEVERSLIQERTLENVEYRRSTGGKMGGRPKAYSQAQAGLVRDLRSQGDSLRTICSKSGLSLGVVQRILA